MFHWLNATRVSWTWSRRPSISALAPADFLVLAALDRTQARAADSLTPLLDSTLSENAIQESLAHLLRHGLVHRFSRLGRIRYKLSRAGAIFLTDSLTKPVRS